MTRLRGLPGLRQCQLICQKTKSCIAFSYELDIGQCSLKNSREFTCKSPYFLVTSWLKCVCRNKYRRILWYLMHSNIGIVLIYRTASLFDWSEHVTELEEVVPISTMYDYQRNVNVEYRLTFQDHWLYNNL